MNTDTLNMDILGRWAIDASIHGVLVLSLTAVVVALMPRRAAAATRHAVWGAGMLGLWIVAFLAAWTPTWTPRWAGFAGQRVASVPAEATPSTSARTFAETAAERRDPPGARALDANPMPRPAVAVAMAANGDTGSAVSPSGAHRAVADSVRHAPTVTPLGPASISAVTDRPAWPHAVAWVWVLGSASIALRLVLGLWGARRLGQRCDVASDSQHTVLAGLVGGWDRLPARVAFGDVAIPMTFGSWRPLVVMPRAFWSWSEIEQRAALLHEFAHVRRRDHATRVAARLAVAMHWWNPAAWWVERRFRMASECACDDAALRGRGQLRPSDYAAGLLAMARGLRRSLPGAAPAMVGEGGLETRIRAVLDPEQRRGGAVRSGACLTFGAVVGAALLSSGLAVARSVDDLQDPRDPVRVAVGGVQAAIDAARPGDVLELAAGVHTESLLVTKPLTLRGMGWDATRIRVEGAGLTIRDAADVVVTGLTVSRAGSGVEGAVMPGAAVEVQGGRVRFEDCAVVGSPASGIAIRGEATVSMRKCLVAAVEATGIQVRGAEPVVEILDCEVRNCRHRGIAIGPGNESTTIRGCRISGSAWHGIRYDDAAPTIENNRIFGNARSGIYASGRSHGVIRGNLFVENRMSAVSCWFHAVDRIERNTFVRHPRETIAQLGAAAPKIVGNLFVEEEVAVLLGNTDAREDGSGSSKGVVYLEDNGFCRTAHRALWRRPRAAVPEALDAAAAGGNRTVELASGELAAKVSQGELSLAAGSPLLIDGLGATECPGPNSAWPLQAEERADGAGEGFRAPDRVPVSLSAVQELAQTWSRRLGDPTATSSHEPVLESMLAAMESDDPARQWAGLHALIASKRVEFDKSRFRESVLALCASDVGVVQARAFYALFNAVRADDDLARLLDALESPTRELAEAGPHLIALFSDMTPDDAAVRVILRLYEDPEIRRQSLNGVWGITAPDALQQWFVELAATAARRNAIYFGLSTFANKNGQAVDVLVRALVEPENAQRALWGLGHGIADASDRTRALDAVLSLAGRGKLGWGYDAIHRMASSYGGPKHAPALRALAGSDLVPDRWKQPFSELADGLEK